MIRLSPAVAQRPAGPQPGVPPAIEDQLAVDDNILNALIVLKRFEVRGAVFSGLGRIGFIRWMRLTAIGLLSFNPDSLIPSSPQPVSVCVGA